MSNKIKLNLGRFNECITNIDDLGSYLSIESLGRDSGSLIFYYKFEENANTSMGPGVIESKILEDGFRIPKFIVANVANGHIDDPDAVNTLLAKIELKIFSMLEKIVEERDFEIKLSDIFIPVQSVAIFDDDQISNGCYGWAELGIAVVVPAPVKV